MKLKHFHEKCTVSILIVSFVIGLMLGSLIQLYDTVNIIRKYDDS